MDYDLTTGMEEDLPSFGLQPPRVLRRALNKPQSAGGAVTDTAQPGSVLPNAIGQYRERASNAYQQGLELMNREPDMAPLQEYAKQRSQSGDAAMLNALAAQYAGESFQPIQAQYLKRAAAARDPLKAGNGFITPEGQYIQDPTAAKDKKAEFLLNQARQYETLAQTAQTAQERAEATRAQNEINNQLRLMGLNIQQQGLAIRAANAGQGNDSKNFKIADNLRGEYLKRADKIQQGTAHAQTVTTLLADPTITNDPTKQVSLIFAFGKMLDPESVVRESEYSLIAGARGLYDSLQQLIPALQTGAKLSPQQLKSMQAIAQTLLSGSNGRVDELASYYESLSRRRGVDPQDVLPSYAKRPGQAAPGGLPSPADIEAELARRAAAKQGGQR